MDIYFNIYSIFCMFEKFYNEKWKKKRERKIYGLIVVF